VVCQQAADVTPWLWTPGTCENIVASFYWLLLASIPFWIWKLVKSLLRRRSSLNLSNPPTSELQTRLRDLLLRQHRWSYAQTRRNLVTEALGADHPLHNDIAWGGSPADEAMAIATAFLASRVPTADGRLPASALLATLAREMPAGSGQQPEIAALTGMLPGEPR
jgi:hypothetical protein